MQRCQYFLVSTHHGQTFRLFQGQVRRAEQKALVGAVQHRQVVEGIAHRHRVVALQRQFFDHLDLAALTGVMRRADKARRVAIQPMTTQLRLAQLAPQWQHHFSKCIRHQHDAKVHAEPQRRHESDGAGQRTQVADDPLHVAQTQSVMAQERDATLDQARVVGIFTRGDGQFVNSADLGDMRPEFGDQDPFHVETSDIH